jgi:ribosomal protein S18 acetylase RimI-like enzyme
MFKLLLQGIDNFININKAQMEQATFVAADSLITIEEAVAADIAGIQEVERDAWAHAYVGHHNITLADRDRLNQNGRLGFVSGYDYLLEIIRNGGETRKLWVAKDGESVIGYSYALKIADEGFIDKLYVHSDYQRRGSRSHSRGTPGKKLGIGTALLTTVEQFLAGQRRIRVDTYDFNEGAKRFYTERHGYTILRTVPSDWFPPEKRVRVAEMEKVLAKKNSEPFVTVQI